jgi:hypothetical protein
MRHIILFLICGMLSVLAKAQQSPVPLNYTLHTPEDFRQYEPDVLDCIRWLYENPRSSTAGKRKQTEDFLVKWIYGCPYVQVTVEAYVMKLSSKNANLLLSFMFGYTHYQLQNLGNKDLLAANLAGLNYLIKDYQLNNKLLKPHGNWQTG